MASSLKYDGGLTCALKVTDLEKAIRWYEEVMDFQLLYKMDDMGWCELKTGVAGVNVGLSQVEKAGGDGGATLTFGVEDIDEARKQIETKDVRFDGDTQTIPDMVMLATFYDPDGNALMMYQDLQRK